MTELRQYAALQLIAINNLEELILTTEMISGCPPCHWLEFAESHSRHPKVTLLRT